MLLYTLCYCQCSSGASTSGTAAASNSSTNTSASPSSGDLGLGGLVRLLYFLFITFFLSLLSHESIGTLMHAKVALQSSVSLLVVE